MRKYIRIYIACWIIVLFLFIAYIVTYALGGTGIRYKGIRISLPNVSNYHLYKINNSIAFEIPDSKAYVSVIGYEKTSGLDALAGKYEYNGEKIYMATADYKKGDFIYTRYPFEKTTIVNITTGEAVGRLADKYANTTDASKLTEYKKRGLIFNDKYKLTPDKIIKQYEQLNTFDENIFEIVIAFFLVFILLLAGGIPIAIRGIKGFKRD